MKAKKKYNTGGIFPPEIQKLKYRAAKKKKQEAPIKGGMLDETTVTAKAPTESERIERIKGGKYKPIGAKQRFFGDPSGAGLGISKAALSFIARTGKKTNAIKSSKMIAGKIKKAANKKDIRKAIELIKKSEDRMKTALDTFKGFAGYQGKGVYGSKQLKGIMRTNKNAALREAKTQDAIASEFGLINPNKRDQVIKAIKAAKK